MAAAPPTLPDLDDEIDHLLTARPPRPLTTEDMDDMHGLKAGNDKGKRKKRAAPVTTPPAKHNAHIDES
eukprot:5934329-Alexandrium_andersonii.AAC.1